MLSICEFQKNVGIIFFQRTSTPGHGYIQCIDRYCPEKWTGNFRPDIFKEIKRNLRSSQLVNGYRTTTKPRATTKVSSQLYNRKNLRTSKTFLGQLQSSSINKQIISIKKQRKPGHFWVNHNIFQPHTKNFKVTNACGSNKKNVSSIYQ